MSIGVYRRESPKLFPHSDFRRKMFVPQRLRIYNTWIPVIPTTNRPDAFQVGFFDAQIFGDAVTLVGQFPWCDTGSAAGRSLRCGRLVDPRALNGHSLALLPANERAADGRECLYAECCQMPILVSLIFCSILFAPSLLFLKIVYRPLHERLKAATASNIRKQMFLCDFFSLTFLFALPAPVFSMISDEFHDSKILVLVAILLFVPIAWIWWRSAMLLSRVGVRDSLPRIIFSGVVVPASIVVAAGAIPVTIGLILGSVIHAREAWMVFILTSSTLLVGWGCERGVAWVVSQGENTRVENEIGTRVDRPAAVNQCEISCC